MLLSIPNPISLYLPLNRPDCSIYDLPGWESAPLVYFSPSRDELKIDMQSCPDATDFSTHQEAYRSLESWFRNAFYEATKLMPSLMVNLKEIAI